MLDTTTRQEINLIVRPYGPGVTFIQLDDDTSCPSRIRRTEPKVPVEVREWIGSAPAPSDLVLEAQPPTQPHSRVVVECPTDTRLV